MSLVHATMKYSATIWDHYHQKDIDKVYKVEKRAVKFIANDYRYDTGSMTQIFKSLGWHALKDRTLTLLYKITKGLVAVIK